LGYINPLYSLLTTPTKQPTQDKHGSFFHVLPLFGEPTTLTLAGQTYKVTDKHITFYQYADQRGPAHITLMLDGDVNKKIRFYINEHDKIHDIKFKSNNETIVLQAAVQVSLLQKITPHIEHTLIKQRIKLAKVIKQEQERIKVLLQACDAQSHLFSTNPTLEHTESYIAKIQETIHAIRALHQNFDPLYERGVPEVLEEIVTFLQTFKAASFILAFQMTDTLMQARATSNLEPSVLEPSVLEPSVTPAASNHVQRITKEKDSKLSICQKQIDELEKKTPKRAQDYVELHQQYLKLLGFIFDKDVAALEKTFNRIRKIKQEISTYWFQNFLMNKNNNLKEAELIINYIDFNAGHFYLAINNGAVELAKFLLKHFKLNINTITTNEMGLLEAAASKNHIEVFKGLLKLGANPLTMDQNGELLIKTLKAPFSDLLREQLSSQLKPEDLNSFLQAQGCSPENLFVGCDAQQSASLVGKVTSSKENVAKMMSSRNPQQTALKMVTTAYLEAQKKEAAQMAKLIIDGAQQHANQHGEFFDRAKLEAEFQQKIDKKFRNTAAGCN
jgi:hypothetical protein